MPRDPRDEVFSDRVRVQHMLQAAQEAVSFAAQRSRPDLERDRMFMRGALHAVTEVGEAARCVTDAGRARAPDVPWASIVGIRHIFIHAYWGIKPDKLWETLTVDLPTLITALEAALDKWPEETDPR